MLTITKAINRAVQGMFSLGGEVSSDGSQVGAVIVKDVGRIAAAQNRQRLLVAETYAAATNSASWVEADDIREVAIYISGNTDAGGHDTSEDFALITINAGSDAAANTALDVTVDSETTDFDSEKMPLNKIVVFRSSDPILRVDVLPVDVSATQTTYNLFVGAK